MKKKIGIIAFCIMLLLNSLVAFAADSGKGPIRGNMTVDGTQVTINLTVDEKSELTNAKLTVAYDSKAYELVSATEGPVLKKELDTVITDINTNKAGIVSLAWAQTDPLNESGTMLTVVLKIKDTKLTAATATVVVDELNKTKDGTPVQEETFTLTAPIGNGSSGTNPDKPKPPTTNGGGNNQGGNQKPSEGQNSETGDNSPIAALVIAAVLAGAAVIVLVVKKKKEA